MNDRSIVDTHVHLWELDRFEYPWLADPGAEELGFDYTENSLREDIGDLNVVATVHVQAEVSHQSDPVEETAWLDSLARVGGSPAIPTVCVGYADLRSADLPDVLDRHSDYPIFRGIRQEAWFDPLSRRADIPKQNMLDDPRWLDGLRELERRDLSFDLLVWPDQLRQATELLRQTPSLTVVLEHLGLPTEATDEARQVWRTGMSTFARQIPNAVLKISALRFVSPGWNMDELAPLVNEAIEIFGPGRCMLGSNFPVDRPAVSYSHLWERLLDITSGLSQFERDAIFVDTAVAAYRINLSGRTP